jgi:hypothetical protein
MSGWEEAAMKAAIALAILGLAATAIGYGFQTYLTP